MSGGTAGDKDGAVDDRSVRRTADAQACHIRARFDREGCSVSVRRGVVRTFALIAAVLTGVSLAAVSVSATSRAGARAAEVFSGNICSLVSASLAQQDGVTAPCKALPVKHSATYANVWTANYGHQVAGRTPHFLGVQVIQYANPNLLAKERALIKFAIAEGRAETTSCGGGYTSGPYSSTVAGVHTVGFQGLGGFIVDGYQCQVTLDDASKSPGPAESIFDSLIQNTAKAACKGL